MSSSKIRTGGLWGKNKDDLVKQLGELRQELVSLRTQKVAGGASAKLTRITDIRKGIARVLTVINATQRSHLRLLYEKKKYTPLDLRPKRTRALRRALTPKEKSLKTEKQKKKESHFPHRRFAIKASA